MNPGFRLLFLEYLNRGVREVLSVDPDTAREFGRLRGKTFCVEITLPPMVLYLVPEPDGFSLAGETESAPDVTLTGPLAAFLRLAGRGPASGVLTDGQVTMQGDAEAGQSLQKILARFDFDWEELIARRIGDLPARRTGNAIRGAARWAEESAELSRENLADFLAEERRLAVSADALRRFGEEVAALRADTDRVARRLDRLAASRKPQNQRD